MNVIHIIDSLHVGGAETLQLTFARAARQSGIHLTVVALRDTGDSTLRVALREEGADVHILSGRGLSDLARLWRLARFLRRYPDAIVHCHLTYANILGVSAARLAGLPAVASIHSAALDPQHTGYKHRLEAWVLRLGVKAVVAVGESIAGAHRQRVGRSFVVVPNAVQFPPILSEAQRQKVRCSLGILPEERLLLSVGRLVAAKGFSDLIEAVALVRRDHGRIRLLIVGEGEEKVALEARIQQLGLSEGVGLLGLRDDVPELLGVADLYVSASHWEGLPLSVLEAMGAALPVVATRVGELPRLLEGGRGILVEPGLPAELARGILAVLADVEEAAAMGERARSYALAHHSPSTWLCRLMEVYYAARALQSRVDGETREWQRLRDHFEVERRLAERLRHASPQARRKLYGEVYDQLFACVPDHPQLTRPQDEATSRNSIERQLLLLEPFFPHNGTYVEVGAGDCALAVEVASRVGQAVAVDVSETITRLEQTPGNFTLRISDGVSIPVPPGSADLIYSNQLMEHLHPDDAGEQLQNIYRALKEGGKYICITPNRLSGPHDISRYWEREAKGFHLREYSASELVSLFRAAGFRSVRLYTTARRLRLPLPSPLLRVVEGALETLPTRMRRRLVKTKPLRVLLSLAVVGAK